MGPQRAPDSRLLPGKSATYTAACEMPTSQKAVHIEGTPGYEYQASIFTGAVK
ncbi:hypothetical protein [Streptomyces sp. NPDC048248]|uniref:hypothetical protein n=1 Tax=Streptomyces sp. NPDC048248 TaxID=3365523 RepID=UPI003713EC32